MSTRASATLRTDIILGFSESAFGIVGLGSGVGQTDGEGKFDGEGAGEGEGVAVGAGSSVDDSVTDGCVEVG